MPRRKPDPPLKSAPHAEWAAYAIELYELGDPRGKPSYVAWNTTIADLQADLAPEPEPAPAKAEKPAKKTRSGVETEGLSSDG